MEDRKDAKRRAAWKEARSWLLTVVLPVLAVLLLNLFVCKVAIVRGSSMYPTLHNGDYLLIRLVGNPAKAGDIVVIRTQKDSVMQGENLVKRVIALEGQTVKIDYEQNKVFVDGVLLEEPYLNEEEADPLLGSGSEEFTVPARCVFVMGDNRNHSSDSRDAQIGMISEDDILGIEIFRLPIGQWLGRENA